MCRQEAAKALSALGDTGNLEILKFSGSIGGGQGSKRDIRDCHRPVGPPKLDFNNQ